MRDVPKARRRRHERVAEGTHRNAQLRQLRLILLFPFGIELEGEECIVLYPDAFAEHPLPFELEVKVALPFDREVCPSTDWNENPLRQRGAATDRS